MILRGGGYGYFLEPHNATLSCWVGGYKKEKRGKRRSVLREDEGIKINSLEDSHSLMKSHEV